MTDLLDALARIVIGLLPLLAWVAWWLWAANWKRLWPVLARGGWAPAVLLLLMAAVVWSRLEPVPCPVLPPIPNVVWQLGVVATLAAVALLCGWLQGRLRWGPSEISVEPPAVADDGHGHHH